MLNASLSKFNFMHGRARIVTTNAPASAPIRNLNSPRILPKIYDRCCQVAISKIRGILVMLIGKFQRFSCLPTKTKLFTFTPLYKNKIKKSKRKFLSSTNSYPTFHISRTYASFERKYCVSKQQLSSCKFICNLTLLGLSP